MTRLDPLEKLRQIAETLGDEHYGASFHAEHRDGIWTVSACGRIAAGAPVLADAVDTLAETVANDTWRAINRLRVDEEKLRRTAGTLERLGYK